MVRPRSWQGCGWHARGPTQCFDDWDESFSLPRCVFLFARIPTTSFATCAKPESQQRQRATFTSQITYPHTFTTQTTSLTTDYLTDRALFAARHDCAGLNLDAATAGVDEPAPRWLAAGLARHQARRRQERLHLRQQLAERSQQVLQGV